MDKPLHLNVIQRVNVIGTSGCGKSTFSKKLATVMDAPYLEIDKMYWRPNWTFLDDDQFFKKMEEELKRDKWVLDGNYTRTTPVKWKNVQAVIWLDYSLLRILSRAISRAVVRVISGIELWEGTGNKESLKMLFSKESIVRWTWNTFDSNRVKYSEMMSDPRYSHIQFIRFSDPSDADRFLRELK
jgi:adenylate kinase family enzyme